MEPTPNYGLNRQDAGAFSRLLYNATLDLIDGAISSIASAAADALAAASSKIPLAQKGTANGVAPLGADTKIAPEFLPPIATDAASITTAEVGVSVQDNLNRLKEYRGVCADVAARDAVTDWADGDWVWVKSGATGKPEAAIFIKPGADPGTWEKLSGGGIGVLSAPAVIGVGNGSQTTFTLPFTGQEARVEVDDLVQIEGVHFTRSGTSITFVEPIPADVEVIAQALKIYDVGGEGGGANSEPVELVEKSPGSYFLFASKQNVTAYQGRVPMIRGVDWDFDVDGDLAFLPDKQVFYADGPNAGDPLPVHASCQVLPMIGTVATSVNGAEPSAIAGTPNTLVLRGPDGKIADTPAQPMVFYAIGPLATAASSGALDVRAALDDTEITEITIVAPKTPASGSIELDLLDVPTDGSAPSSLFTSNPKPTIACDGNPKVLRLTLAGDLPDITARAALSLTALKILSAPDGAEDVTVYVR